MFLIRITTRGPESILSPRALVGIGNPSQSAAVSDSQTEQSVTTAEPGPSKAASCSEGDSEIQTRTCLTKGCPSKDKVFGTIKYFRTHEK
jgi:hypothetical protein